MFGLTLGKFIVLMIVGGLAGSLAGRISTLSRTGFGPWINLGVGMIGALIGKAVFYLLRIDLGLGELKISFEDLFAAFVGSMLCIIGWWLVRMFRKKRLAVASVK